MYFQWGDTSGYTANQVGKAKYFNWNYYKFSIDGSDTNFSKYTIKGATLELEDDAAHVNMGGSWHMPTPTQFQELINETTNTRTTLDGVNGILFTSKIDSSKSIFIPVAGIASVGSVNYSGSDGYLWSSMLDTNNVEYGQYLEFGFGGIYLDHHYRYNGLSVRGVVG